MSDSNRGGRIAAIGALVCLILVSLGVGAFFGALSAPHYGYQAEYPANRAADTKQADPSQIDRDRAGLPYLAERIASGPDPKDSDEREKRDLAAQESMSVWAFWLLMVTSVGTVTTMAGTGLLLWTLHETRQTARRQLRAYLSFDGLQISVFASKNVPGGRRIEIATKIINGGQTPAYEAMHMGNVVVFTEEEARAYFAKFNRAPRVGTPTPYTVHNGRDVAASFYPTKDMTSEELAAVESGTKDLYAFGEVVYRDTLDRERVTRFCYVLASPLIPKKLDPSGVTTTGVIWGIAPFHNDAT